MTRYLIRRLLWAIVSGVSLYQVSGSNHAVARPERVRARRFRRPVRPLPWCHPSAVSKQKLVLWPVAF